MTSSIPQMVHSQDNISGQHLEVAAGWRAGGSGKSAVAVVGCVSMSSLWRRAVSGTEPSVAAEGCVGNSSLVRAGRQSRQCVYPRRFLVRLSQVG